MPADHLENIMAVPKLVKIVVNVGVKEALVDKKVLDHVSSQLAIICGQKPVINKAKVSIATFKLRKGEPVGVSVTLRGRRMSDFFTRLVSIVLPRVRDFHGVSPDSFDISGNYSLGISEQIVFPEIEYDKIDRIRSLEVTIVTTAKDKARGLTLLTALGMPFIKNG
ncbi:MAG: 50S ribosomal protein L5 [Patescibacteria group bacterium]